MKSSMLKSVFLQSLIIAPLLCLFGPCADAQIPTYDGAIANGAPGLSRTYEPDPNGGYTEKTYLEDSNGIKHLVEIRKYPKGKKGKNDITYHWVTAEGPNGSTYSITGTEYGGDWHVTKEVTDKDGGKTTYVWEETGWNKGYWKSTGRTPPPSKTPPVEQTPKTNQTAWSGPYFGGQIIKSAGRVVTTEKSAATGLITNQFTDNHDPVGGGINGGYDWLPFNNKFLVGVGFDADFPNEDVQHSFATGAYLKSTVDFAGLVQARAGYLVMQNFLVYCLTGVSVADQHIEMNLGGATTDTDQFTPGFTAGAGVEWMITTASTGGPRGFLRAPSIFVEYAHTWWADAELNQPAASPTFNYSWARESDTIRVGFRVRF